jgi:hypothetical protein
LATAAELAALGRLAGAPAGLLAATGAAAALVVCSTNAGGSDEQAVVSAKTDTT